MEDSIFDVTNNAVAHSYFRTIVPNWARFSTLVGMYPQGRLVRPRSQITFPIPLTLLQPGGILPTITKVAPKFPLWIRPWVYLYLIHTCQASSITILLFINSHFHFGSENHGQNSSKAKLIRHHRGRAGHQSISSRIHSCKKHTQQIKCFSILCKGITGNKIMFWDTTRNLVL